jgi:hypothetical protein
VLSGVGCEDRLAIQGGFSIG